MIKNCDSHDDHDDTRAIRAVEPLVVPDVRDYDVADEGGPAAERGDKRLRREAEGDKVACEHAGEAGGRVRHAWESG